MIVITRKSYVIKALLVVSILNFTDHMVFALLMEDIKADLQLSDTKMGLLGGLAFAIFYCTLGIPIARYSDSGANRVSIISTSVALFSAMTALCGMATGFIQLLLFRIGVGAGEAGCTPPAHSLIADYFDRSSRPQAMSIYMMGAPFGVLVGFLLGGWINEWYGWRVAFIAIGLPGVFIAFILKASITDPRVKQKDVTFDSTKKPARLSTVLHVLWRQKTFRHITLGLSLLYFMGYGISQWQPAFFIRSHGMESGELGTWMALISGLGGVVGVWLGGYLAVRFAARDEKRQLIFIALSGLLVVCVNAAIYMVGDKISALLFLALSNVFGMLCLGPIYALVQGLVQEKMRAIAVAVLYLIINFVGMGLGPLAIGILSDSFVQIFGIDALRYANIAIMPAYIWGSYHLWLASKTVETDLKAISLSENLHRDKISHISSVSVVNKL